MSIYLTNPFPVCEVRIPLRRLTDACSRSALAETTQPLQLLAELANLSFVLPVVNLTDSAAVKQVEVRCLGSEKKRDGYAYQVSGTPHELPSEPAIAPGSEDLKEAALEGLMLALCTEAAKFAFTTENLPRR